MELSSVEADLTENGLRLSALGLDGRAYSGLLAE
jgi:hypothetical protein